MKKLLLKHSSLLLIATGSFNFFLLNIILKHFLNDLDYSLYSIFVTYLSLLISFGLLGTDYTFIRISEYKNNNFFTDKKFLKIIFVIIFLFSFIYTFVIWKIYFYKDNFFIILFITLTLLINLLTYNILRLSSKFFLSQLINNFWRFFSIIFVLILYLINSKIFSFTLILQIFFILFIILFFINFFSLKNIKFLDSKSEINILDLSIQHLISNLILSIMSFFDRFVVENNLGLIELSNYFFLSNLFLYPFFIFQNYITFKEVVSFKKEISLNLLKNKIRNIIIFSLIFSITLFLSVFLINYFNIYKINNFNKNISWILLMLILGIMRNIYSVLSSAGGALSNPIFVKKLNLFSIILFIIIILPYYFKFNVEEILITFIILWFLRIIIMFNLIKDEIIKINLKSP